MVAMCLTVGYYYQYRWFLWGVVSLPEGKSRGLHLVQLCAKYKLLYVMNVDCVLHRGRW